MNKQYLNTVTSKKQQARQTVPQMHPHFPDGQVENKASFDNRMVVEAYKFAQTRTLHIFNTLASCNKQDNLDKQILTRLNHLKRIRQITHQLVSSSNEIVPNTLHICPTVAWLLTVTIDTNYQTCNSHGSTVLRPYINHCLQTGT